MAEGPVDLIEESTNNKINNNDCSEPIDEESEWRKSDKCYLILSIFIGEMFRSLKFISFNVKK